MLDLQLTRLQVPLQGTMAFHVPYVPVCYSSLCLRLLSFHILAFAGGFQRVPSVGVQVFVR